MKPRYLNQDPGTEQNRALDAKQEKLFHSTDYTTLTALATKGERERRLRDLIFTTYFVFCVLVKTKVMFVTSCRLACPCHETVDSQWVTFYWQAVAAKPSRQIKAYQFLITLSYLQSPPPSPSLSHRVLTQSGQTVSTKLSQLNCLN